MIRCDAMAMVCSPDEQNRFTVIPDVVTGHPARIAICRAMLRPVAPSGFAHPIITSSISPGSSRARSIAWRSACPPSVAPWVMLNAPRQLLQSGVRAVETITASGITTSREASVLLSFYNLSPHARPRRCHGARSLARARRPLCVDDARRLRGGGDQDRAARGRNRAGLGTAVLWRRSRVLRE